MEESEESFHVQILREEIDQIDDNIAELLFQRQQIAKMIQARDSGHKPEREEEIKNRLSKEFPSIEGLIDDIYDRIFKHSTETQYEKT